jgi:hypothetical protein
MDKELAKIRVRESVIHAIRETAQQAFAISQRKCPVDTGLLKSTGRIDDIENGIAITYSAPYASFVHNGIKAGLRNVPSYSRRNGVRVREYSYTALGLKPNPFIKSALDEAFKDFSEKFDNKLRGSTNGKVRKE